MAFGACSEIRHAEDISHRSRGRPIGGTAADQTRALASGAQMANRARAHPDNAPGAWFVDDSCSDCDASRQCAPALFRRVGEQSVIARQPESAEEIAAATRALLACPSASIGVDGIKPDLSVFPQELTEGVFYCGYNSEKSYGANAFFLARKGGNALVDSPRFVPRLVDWMESKGGLRLVLLTHQDDVADARKYAEHFNARVVIHDADKAAAPFATELLHGSEPRELAPGLTAIPVPGHTRGSVCYLSGTALFTGDSLYWSRELQDLCAFRRQCWYSWEEQTASLERLGAFSFEWVLAGHGDRVHLPAPEMRRRLAELVSKMKRGDPILEPGRGWPGALW